MRPCEGSALVSAQSGLCNGISSGFNVLTLVLFLFKRMGRASVSVIPLSWIMSISPLSNFFLIPILIWIADEVTRSMLGENNLPRSEVALMSLPTPIYHHALPHWAWPINELTNQQSRALLYHVVTQALNILRLCTWVCGRARHIKPRSVHYILSSSLPTNPHRSVHSGMSRRIYLKLLYRIIRITEANKKILE